MLEKEVTDKQHKTLLDFQHTNIVMHCLTLGIQSEKCVVRQFHHSVNIIECAYANLDGILHT